MRGSRSTRRIAATAVAAAAFVGIASASASGAPAFEWNAAIQGLQATAAGNPVAEQAVNRLITSGQRAGDVALPAQPFQIPAQSDIGRGGGPGVYGSGVALGMDGFRFGLFGGPGAISPDQTGAKLEVMWFNLSNGRSGTNLLIEHQDVPVDTTIRTAVIDPGPGMVVAAVYGSVWHRWPVPVSDANPDGFRYQLSTISVPSFGAVYN
ncbi:hypothetical protein GFY24_32405 [Nocardia sp. SYP-A9097]|uniref:hypothetical protein n=1 Tax=Nocardia sp. SYP-A9097 TaxID=2663237 RepID=UPI00129B4855|nr:hypothetical protein [Nocardia sp. SYP-A9097]MRH92088.1 hypothetical protein [Nocardia sp. SYP-A9097]